MSRLTGRTASLKKSAISEHIISEREVFLHMKPKNKPQSSKSKESVADKAAKIFGKKMPEPTPGQIATQNRDISAEIISVLHSIDFAHGRLKDLIDEEEYRTMIRVRDMAMKMLQESPTIFDEVAQIGAEMSYAAKAWKEAVKDGMPKKAMYAKQAVASGASSFWSNIPEDKEEERAAILKTREEYFANFKLAIQTGEKIDNLEKRIAKTHTQIEKVMQVHRVFADQLIEMSKTSEGKDRFARIYSSVDNLDFLSTDDMDFAMQLRDDMSRERELMRLRGQYSVDRQDLVARNEELSKVGLALRRNPDQSNKDLTADIAKLTKRIEDELSHRMSELAVIETENKNEMDRLDGILNGPAAKALYGTVDEHLKKLQGGNRLSPEKQAVLDANRDEVERQNRMREEWELEKARQKEADRQAEATRQAAMEAAKQAQESVETAQAENENVAAESADNFNYNF